MLPIGTTGENASTDWTGRGGWLSQDGSGFDSCCAVNRFASCGLSSQASAE